MNRLSFQKQKEFAQLSTSSPTPRNKGEYHGQNSENFRARPAQSQGSVAQGGSWSPAYSKGGKTYPGKCHDGEIGCFK